MALEEISQKEFDKLKDLALEGNKDCLTRYELEERDGVEIVRVEEYIRSDDSLPHKFTEYAVKQ